MDIIKKIEFSFSENIILSIILLNVLVFSSLPVVNIGITNNCILLVLIFLFLFLVNIDSTKLFSIISIKINVFLFLGLSIIFFFIISSFYINFDYNLRLSAIAKLSIYPVIISFFLFYIPRLIYKKSLLFEKFLNFWLYIAISSIFTALVILYLGIEYKYEYSGLAIGFYYSPNIFAFVFTFTIPIIIYKYLAKRISLIPFLFLLIPSLICLLFTFSRAGYLGVFTAIVILLYKRSKKLFIIGAVILIFLGSTVVLPIAQTKGASSAVSRVEVMYAGYNMIMNNGISKFLWGYGVINSRAVFVREVTNIYGLYREELGPHNAILSLGIQFGMLLTFSSLAYILLLVFKASFWKKKLVQFEYSQRVSLSISIVLGIMIQCLFEDLVIYPEFFAMPLFLVFLGYLYYFVNSSNKT